MRNAEMKLSMREEHLMGRQKGLEVEALREAASGANSLPSRSSDSDGREKQALMTLPGNTVKRNVRLYVLSVGDVDDVAIR